MKKFELSRIESQMKKHRSGLTKGLLMSILLCGTLVSHSAEVSADAWKVNDASEISKRIDTAEKSLTMIDGDTVWNLGLALNIKNPMDLLYENDYEVGDQYHMSVGTKIYFNGNHVKIVSNEGDIIGGGVVIDKMNDTQPIAYQETDDFDYEYNNVNQEIWKDEDVSEIEEAVVPEEIPADNENTAPSNPSAAGYANFDTHLANQRAAEGLAPVQYSSAVQRAADVRAQEIVASYSHTRPSGTIFELLDQSNVAANTYGECIMKFSYTGNDEAEIDAITFDAWMNSPGHRAILMSGDYTSYGYRYVQHESVVYAVYLAAG